jgi:hypothetical protein
MLCRRNSPRSLCQWTRNTRQRSCAHGEDQSQHNTPIAAAPFAGAAVPFGVVQGPPLCTVWCRCLNSVDIHCYRYFSRPHMPAFHLSWLAFFAGE